MSQSQNGTQELDLNSIRPKLDSFAQTRSRLESFTGVRPGLISQPSSRPGSRPGSRANSRPSSPTRALESAPSTRPPTPGGIDEDEFVGSIDCGTTSCRFIIFDQYGRVVCSHQIEFEQIYPQAGWHEHDPTTYEDHIDECIKIAVDEFESLGHEKGDIKAVGLTTQRETTIAWSRTTGKPLYNAIAWPDARNAATVRKLRARSEHHKWKMNNNVMHGEEGLRALTGLPFSTYFSATKYAWMLENVEEVRKAKESGDLMIGTVDSWLVWNYTGATKGGSHVTDVTNASRTLLLSLHTLEWDAQLLKFFDMPREALPKIVSNAEQVGQFKKGHLLEGVPIAGIVGDQQAALIGNKCFSLGEAKQTYGTGCFMLFNTGPDIVMSRHGLLTTVGYRGGPNSKVFYALEGSIAVGGSSVNWLRDNLGIAKNAKEVGQLAASVKDTGGIYFVTAFSGLFAPYWDMQAAGMMIGLSAYSTKAHIARATLEATCFQTRAILEAMAKDLDDESAVDTPEGEGRGPAGLKVLKVDGGMTASDVTMQMQADILGIPVQRPKMRESTALGAALLAGSALKLFGWDLEDPSTFSKVNVGGVRLFEPALSEEEKEWKFAGWNRAIERCKGWRTESGNG